MIGSLGVPELIFILVLVLLVFGPKRLPEIGRTVGKGLAEFRRASSDLKRTINAELALDEEPRPPRLERLDPHVELPGTEARSLTPAEAFPMEIATDPTAAPAPPEPGASEPAGPEPVTTAATTQPPDSRPLEPS